MSARRPNFLFIGGDRCGSKWLHNVLLLHPNVVVPTLADPYFFDRYYDRGWEWYLPLFESSKTDVRAVGELSHDYLFSRVAAERIRNDIPEVKILATLRQPFNKAYSAYNMWKSTGYLDGTFESALSGYPELFEQALYSRWLDPYFSLFPRNQIKIMVYDDLTRSPRRFAQQVLDFLDTPFVHHLDYETVYNDFSVPRVHLSGVLAKRLALLFRGLQAESALGQLKRNSAIRSIFFKKPSKRPNGKLPRASFEKLRARVDDDIVEVQRATGLDLRHWLRHEDYVEIVE